MRRLPRRARRPPRHPVTIPSPRPGDFLHAELLRHRDLRDRYTHAAATAIDTTVAEQMLKRIDARIDGLLDELADFHRRRDAAMAVHPSASA